VDSNGTTNNNDIIISHMLTQMELQIFSGSLDQMTLRWLKHKITVGMLSIPWLLRCMSNVLVYFYCIGTLKCILILSFYFNYYNKTKVMIFNIKVERAMNIKQ